MFKVYISYLLIGFSHVGLLAQNSISINAILNAESKMLTIEQSITYTNTTKDTLNTIYLNDWNNSYATKSTPLAKRFEEEFSTKFHLAKSKQRGYTQIKTFRDINGLDVVHKYLKSHPDIIKVKLNKPLAPGLSYSFSLNYKSKIPDASFTKYGYTKNNNFNLKYWYISPVVYDGKWHFYSNKNLDDLFVPKSDIAIKITYPIVYKITSELDVIESKSDIKTNTETVFLKGKNRLDSYLQLSVNPNFLYLQTGAFTIVSDIQENSLTPIQKGYMAEKIALFLTRNLGSYPHKKLLANEIEYNKSPLYGINQLPDFLRIFSNEFQYELKLLKTALKKYLENTLMLNPRKESWLMDGIKIYFLIEYVKKYYPNTKLFGSLSKIWGLRSFHAANLDFNSQYFLYFMEIARKNKDQPLSTSKDSLIKYNANIANPYKAGLGLQYLDDFMDDVSLKETIKTFLEIHKIKQVYIKDFKNFLSTRTKKNIDWFFLDYVTTRKKIDFKIKFIEEETDSIAIIVKNKRSNNMPTSLYKIKNDSVIDKIWIEKIINQKTLKLANDDTESIVLGYCNSIPEFNQRDNYKSLNDSFFNKPFQFRLFKDIEDPNYNQVFFMPIIEFNNIYDGLTLGTKVYNKTVLTRKLNYRISPQYATNSKSLTGSASVFYTHNLENHNLFDISHGISAAYESFGQDTFFTQIRPSIKLTFRDDDDFRKDQRDVITARFINIQSNTGNNAIIEVEEPDYSVLNLRYVHSKPGIINFQNFATDFQLAGQFTKLSLNYEFRKLTKNNRNINIRFFAGFFLENNTNPNSDYFSFALDRPTDYLFDFNYLGRSETSGLFSQQIIIAEGGFKSKLLTPFANQWMITGNFATSIWQYIQAYGDIGVIKNRLVSPEFVYDSGIRLNLVEDYFEIFFPVYSNLGWEISQPNYGERIRFMFTVEPQVLLGLFTRKWY